jgi:hypothetical protein
MFEEGSIIYFTPFYFNSPSTPPKPKYFIVVKHVSNMTILASLPSSQKHLPISLQSTFGCLEAPDSGIGCYAFREGVPIATNGFAFPLDSYLYGQHLDEYNIDIIAELYPFDKIQYEIKGKLFPNQLKDITDCLKNSAAVKRRFKRYL